MSKDMSTIETAVDLMEKKKTPQPIQKFLIEVSQVMGVIEVDPDFLAQLYIDITTSSRFIFCGDDMWDLKERHMDLWDKDGSFFNDKGAVEDEEDDGITVDDYFLDSDEEEIIEDDETFIEDEDDELDKVYYDSDEEDATDDDEEETVVEVVEEEDSDEFDEDQYGNLMDDYEKYYE